MKVGPKPSKAVTALTSSGQAASGIGALSGLFVSAASGSPSITVYDNTAGSGTVIVPTFTPVAGTSYQFPDIEFLNGCYIVIGGTVTVQPFIRT